MAYPPINQSPMGAQAPSPYQPANQMPRAGNTMPFGGGYDRNRLVQAMMGGGNAFAQMGGSGDPISQAMRDIQNPPGGGLATPGSAGGLPQMPAGVGQASPSGIPAPASAQPGFNQPGLNLPGVTGAGSPLQLPALTTGLSGMPGFPQGTPPRPYPPGGGTY